jgi:hypothetical protein
MDQITIIVNWLGENQTALLAAIATLTAAVPAMATLWIKLRNTIKALDTTTKAIETAPPGASAKVKKRSAELHELLPKGAARDLLKSIGRAGG